MREMPQATRTTKQFLCPGAQAPRGVAALRGPPPRRGRRPRQPAVLLCRRRPGGQRVRPRAREDRFPRRRHEQSGGGARGLDLW